MISQAALTHGHCQKGPKQLCSSASTRYHRNELGDPSFYYVFLLFLCRFTTAHQVSSKMNYGLLLLGDHLSKDAFTTDGVLHQV